MKTHNTRQGKAAGLGKTMIFRPFILISLIIYTGSLTPALAITKQEQTALARTMLDSYIRPGYARFQKQAQSLQAKTKALCSAPSDSARQDVQTAFANTVQAFARIEHLRFGAITKKHRLERLAFWPDRKSIGLKQVKKALKTQDSSVLSVASLQNKSVALQGLTALEYILFGTGYDALAKGDKSGKYRCSYAAAITKNIAQVSSELVQEWSDSSPHVKAYLHPTPDSDIYMSHREVTQTLFLSFLTGLKLVKDFKVKIPLGVSLEKARPTRAAFWRSGLSFRGMASTLDSVHQMFLKGGFAILSEQAEPNINDSISFEFRTVRNGLLSFRQPIRQVVTDKAQRAKLKALLPALNNIYDNAGASIAKATDMTVGFNALDGD